MKKVYLVVDEHDVVTNITFDETDNYYCEVDDSVSIEQIMKILEIGDKSLKWDSKMMSLTELQPRVITSVELNQAIEQREEEMINIQLALADAIEMMMG